MLTFILGVLAAVLVRVAVEPRLRAWWCYGVPTPTGRSVSYW